MKHFYQNIQGWFSFPRFYSQVVKQSPQTAHFVEVGTWKGTSAAFMAVEIVNSGKNIKFDCVDTWEGDNDIGSSFHEPLLEVKGALYEHFLSNISSVNHVINPIVSDSTSASKTYNDNSLDMVFVDGAHDYDSVKNDITNWLPKVREGGIISGHDIAHPPVRQAVTEVFGNDFIDFGENVWLHLVRPIPEP